MVEVKVVEVAVAEVVTITLIGSVTLARCFATGMLMLSTMVEAEAVVTAAVRIRMTAPTATEVMERTCNSAKCMFLEMLVP